MRALLGMVLFSMVGCDTLWASYVGMGDFGSGSDMTCTEPTGCNTLPDLATGDAATPVDMVLPGCRNNDVCAGSMTPYCDLNTGTCVNMPSAAGAFMDPMETTLNQQYMTMATGDYNGDGIADVVVTGVFTGPVNATNANVVPVDVYLGNGMGGLAFDASCSLNTGDKPVHLLTVPGTNPNNVNQSDFFVATYNGPLYRCSRGTNNQWAATPILIAAGKAPANGFRQLALVTGEGRTKPDLALRTNKNLFTEGTGVGNIDVHRANGNNFNGLAVNITDSNATGMQAYHIGTAAYDSVGVLWDDANKHPGVEFHYISNGNTEVKQGSGDTGKANTPGIAYGETGNSAYASTAAFHLSKTNVGILFTYSQAPNSVTVLYGTNLMVGMANVMTSHGQQYLTGIPFGLVLPYAGDANSDDRDEIGLYSLSLTGNAITRHLQLLSYNDPTINTNSPIIDLTTTTENYRGMALEFLASPMDRRRQAGRKDLIVLVEPAGGGKSRLVVRRANLNYTAF